MMIKDIKVKIIDIQLYNVVSSMTHTILQICYVSLFNFEIEKSNFNKADVKMFKECKFDSISVKLIL